MIIRARSSDVIKHMYHAHQPRQCGHFDCLWGFSNVKHGDDSGNRGRAARRKFLARGKKFWKMTKEKIPVG